MVYFVIHLIIKDAMFVRVSFNHSFYILIFNNN